MNNFKPSSLAVVSIYAQDIPTTAHFYLDVIGLPLLQDHHDPIAFDIGGTYLVILRGDPPCSANSDNQSFPLLTFAVNDLDQALQHLEAHRVEISGGVMEKNETRWVLFRDPAGNLIEFAQFGDPLN